MEREPFIRPDNLMKAVFGEDVPELSAEEQAMKSLLMEAYKKSQKNLLEVLRSWRSEHSEASLGEAIRALYQELEDQKMDSNESR